MQRAILVFTILILLGLSLAPVSAQIHIGGSLSGVLVDTTYIVDSVIYIMPDSSLIVEPGAVILFDSIYSFIIQGYLYAAGIPTDSIYFMPSPGQDSLGAITFQTMAADSCVLSYCYVTGASASAVNVYQTDMTISHCTFTNNKANWGGGVYVSFAAPTISNCVVTNNSALRNGGGIYCTNSAPIITDCIITGNSCNLLYGTGASGRGGGGITANHNSSPTITNCLVTNNHSLENGGGFAINDNSNVTLTNCLIYSNVADSAGGGVFCSVNCVVPMTVCLIYQNYSAFNGGGICLIENVNLVMDFCEIVADSSGGNGGGLYSFNSNPTIAHSKIRMNRATGIHAARGGGMALSNCTNVALSFSDFIGNYLFSSADTAAGGGIDCDFSTLHINHLTISGNIASGLYPGVGGGIACHEAFPQIINSIIWENSPQQIFGEPGVIYSDVGGAAVWPGIGNINTNPQFINSNGQDFRLLWTSPCINTGDPDSLDPDGTRADMGAYYYDQSTPVRILLTPHNTPNVIPTNGGSLNFTIQVNNRDLIAQQTTAWCDITVPDSSIFGPVIGPITLDLPGNTTLSRQRMQNVPASAPWGIYHFNAYALVGADTSKDSFTFVKLGASGGRSESGDWSNTGEDFDIADVGAQNFVPLPPEKISVSVSPNPFNPTTIISFELREATIVTLEVFDVQGRGVSGSGTITPIGGRSAPTMYGAGSHQITFDGSKLPSGIYFARLTAGENVAMQKLVLLK